MKFGIDRLLEEPALREPLLGKRLALLAHPASVTRNLEASIDQQMLGADLVADIRLAGGTPADMIFDIGGSRLLLGEVRIAGEKQQFEGEEWSASLDLTRGNTTWRAPLILDLEAELTMSDSRPLAALFRNEGGPK